MSEKKPEERSGKFEGGAVNESETSIPTKARRLLNILAEKVGMRESLTHRDLVLYNPTREHIRELLKDAALFLKDNYGLRAGKFIDPETQETNIIVWPAHGWYHRDFDHEVVREYGNRVIHERAEFDFDLIGNSMRDPGFTPQRWADIMTWMRKPVEADSRTRLSNEKDEY